MRTTTRRLERSNTPRSLVLLALCTIGLGCQSPQKGPAKAPEAEQAPAAANEPAQAAPTPAASAEAQTVVVYSGRGAVLVEPLFEIFSKATGIKVDARFGKSTAELANQLAAEGDSSPADVFFGQDSGYLGLLGKKGFLSKLPAAALEQVPAHYRDTAGHWVGISGRARVLVYNPKRVKPAELPATLKELAAPRWKGRFGWAPSNASFQAHISALRHIWGEAETRSWLEAMKGLEPEVYPKNSPQVIGVSKGEIDVGWVNHYYLHKLRKTKPELVAANYSFRTQGDPGNLLMLSGVGITKNAPHPKAALELVGFLLSEQAQRFFSEKVFEYVTRKGMQPNSALPTIGGSLAQVDQAHLTDLSPTLALLRTLGLN